MGTALCKFLDFDSTICLELTASHSKKCTNIIPVQISARNLVCPGIAVECEERCICVWLLNVDECIWIGRGGKEWRGGGESMRGPGKRRRHGVGGWEDRLSLVLLLISFINCCTWVDEWRLVCACHSVCVCVCVCSYCLIGDMVDYNI